jgi:hypothetical protein
MLRYLLGAVVVLVTLLAALLAHKLRSPDVIVDVPAMLYTRPSAADLLVSPTGFDHETMELTALPLREPLANP